METLAAPGRAGRCSSRRREDTSEGNGRIEYWLRAAPMEHRR